MNRQWIWTTLLVVSCGRVEVRTDGVDLESARLVDLSYTYDEETLYWPTSPSLFELTELAYGATEDGFFYSAYSFCTPEHGGTHIDAPSHFAEGAPTAAEIPLRQLIAKGVVIDMSERAEADPGARLDLATVRGWEERNGPVPAGAIVILRTGWGSRWPGSLAYLGATPPVTRRTFTSQPMVRRPRAFWSRIGASEPWGSIRRVSTTGNPGTSSFIRWQPVLECRASRTLRVPTSSRRRTSGSWPFPSRSERAQADPFASWLWSRESRASVCALARSALGSRA